MKYLVVMVIAFVALVAADDDWKPIADKERFNKIHEDCSKEAGLTTEQNENITKKEYSDEKEIQEYLLCCMKTVEIFSEDKGFCVGRLMSQYNAMFGDVESERDNVKNCVDSNEEKSNPAKWTHRVLTCIMNTKIGELFKKSDYLNGNTA